MTIAVFTFSLLGAMALGMPIAFALIICGVALMSTINMFDSQIVAQNIINGADSFPLMAIPFFMLAGEIMNKGGLAKRIVNVALVAVGHFRGGLGYVTILAACILSSLSGSAAADAAALAAAAGADDGGGGTQEDLRGRTCGCGRRHRSRHSAQHRFRHLRRRRRRLDLQAVSRRHLSGADAGCRLVRRLVVGGPQGKPDAAAAGVIQGSCPGRDRRLLGADVAGDHHRRLAFRHLYADGGRRGRRGLFAVRDDLHLSRTEILAAVWRLRLRRPDHQHRDVPGGRGAGVVLADHGVGDLRARSSTC